MMKFFTLKILNIFDYFYQKKFINFLKKKGINNFNVLIDIGAHKGESINLFANNFKINQIYSFEPSPISYKILSQNIDIHYSHISSITLHSKLCLLGSNICQN